jgi:hypothetical protein
MDKLNQNDIRLLREKGLVTESDIVYMMGQVIIAENIQSGVKRIVEAPNLLLECRRQILRG